MSQWIRYPAHVLPLSMKKSFVLAQRLKALCDCGDGGNAIWACVIECKKEDVIRCALMSPILTGGEKKRYRRLSTRWIWKSKAMLAILDHYKVILKMHRREQAHVAKKMIEKLKADKCDCDFKALQSREDVAFPSRCEHRLAIPGARNTMREKRT